MESQASEENSLLLNPALSRAYSGTAGCRKRGRASWQMAVPVVSWRPMWETIVCILVFIYVLVLFSSSRGTQML